MGRCLPGCRLTRDGRGGAWNRRAPHCAEGCGSRHRNAVCTQAMEGVEQLVSASVLARVQTWQPSLHCRHTAPAGGVNQLGSGVGVGIVGGGDAGAGPGAASSASAVSPPIAPSTSATAHRRVNRLAIIRPSPPAAGSHASELRRQRGGWRAAPRPHGRASRMVRTLRARSSMLKGLVSRLVPGSSMPLWTMALRV